ncbi:MAG: SpoIIE family protein phosphatase [Verrucomicrobia bacterium]|nr:SpoIIE family protein phosphatase [Verrucomicrobiota bacterium]
MTKATITIVEDEMIIARELAARLNVLGYDVADIAASKQEAIQRVTARQPDLVFMDIVLKGNGDGIEAAEEIHRRFDIPIIYVTAYADESTLQRAKIAEPFGYIIKPFSESTLRAVIEMALYKHGMEHQLRAMNEQLEQRVKERTRELQEKNTAMREELRIAQELQTAMLPHHFPVIPRGATPEQSALRFFSHYIPAGSVGGDYFDVIQLSDTAVGVFICDVVGHDVSAALVTAMLRSLVEELSVKTADPGRMLGELNRTLSGFFQELGRTMFVSAFYLIADVKRGQMLYSNAGHPNPVHLRRREGTIGLLQVAGRNGPAMGLFKDAVYPTGRCMLAIGDMVLLLTDGILEVENPGQEFYGKDRLIAAVSGLAELPGHELLGQLLADVRRFSHSDAIEDDVCLVGIDILRMG